MKAHLSIFISLLFSHLITEGQEFNPKPNWKDSYQAEGMCWCMSTFDHELDTKTVTINGKAYSVVDICDELEKHPAYRDMQNGDPAYNDIQCGNGPVNNAPDEAGCPGRVDLGPEGCDEIGPTWDMLWLASRIRFGGTGSRIDSLVVFSADCNSALLNWADTEGEDAFHIYRKSVEDTLTKLAEVTANTTTFSDSMVNPGLTYTYQIIAFKQEQAIANSSQEFVKISECANNFSVQIQVMLQGIYQDGQMSAQLQDLLPTTDPYFQLDSVSSIASDISDWVLVQIRDSSDFTKIIAQKAALLRKDGQILSIENLEEIRFLDLPDSVFFVSVLHRSHLGVASATPVSSNSRLDFTNPDTPVMGNNSRMIHEGIALLYVGDFDGNTLINNEDYNKWKQNSATLDAYLPADGDANKIINNLDYNLWRSNRSKVGVPGLSLDQ